MLPASPSVRSLRHQAFTLMEMLVVVGIIAALMLLLAPAFTNLNQAGDVRAAADTVKGVLEVARATAIARDTYSWVGFYEEDASKASTIPPTPGNGRLVLSVVASTDGTNIYGNGNGAIDSAKLQQVGKLLRIENVHVPLFAVGTGTGAVFDTRPGLQADPPPVVYNYSRFGELNGTSPNVAPYTSPYNFQYPVGNPPPAPQYVFTKLLQFGPTGEARVNGDSYQVRRFVEIGLVQTHGSTVPTPINGAGTSMATYSGNVVALQITGFGGNVTIYTR